MTVVSSRDLRNSTAEILRKVADGDRVTITVNGVPVAEIAPRHLPGAPRCPNANSYPSSPGARQTQACAVIWPTSLPKRPSWIPRVRLGEGFRPSPA
jgi:prevent-host-death family protein